MQVFDHCSLLQHLNLNCYLASEGSKGVHFFSSFFISEKQKPSEIPKCLIEIHLTWFAGLSFLRVSPVSAPTSLDVSNVGTLWTVVLRQLFEGTIWMVFCWGK